MFVLVTGQLGFGGSPNLGTWTGFRTAAGSRYFTSAQPVPLTRGWNLVAAPPYTPAPHPDYALTMSTIATQIDPNCAAGPCSGKAIACLCRSTSSYSEVYVPGGSGGAYAVPATSGMMIEMSKATTWTPSE